MLPQGLCLKALNVWVGLLGSGSEGCQRAAPLSLINNPRWQLVNKTFGGCFYHVYISSLLIACFFLQQNCCSQENWTCNTITSAQFIIIFTLTVTFICSFSKATLTTTPTGRIYSSLRSTPDTSESSPGSGTSASLYAWSCWAAMIRNSSVTNLTVLHPNPVAPFP